MGFRKSFFRECSNMPKSPDKNTEEKRSAILASAEELLTRFGAKRVTVEEICRTAGVSKMTFYKHFHDKVDLVRHLHDALVDRSFTVFDEISERKVPFPEKIELMGRWKQEFMARLDAGFFRELLDIEHSLEAHKWRYVRNIAKAQESGDVRADVNPEFLWLVLETLGGLFKSDEWRASCPDLGEAQRQLRIIIWQGLLVRGRDETPRQPDGKGDTP
jgi:AcrR family transcriptional regulator